MFVDVWLPNVTFLWLYNNMHAVFVLAGVIAIWERLTLEQAGHSWEKIWRLCWTQIVLRVILISLSLRNHQCAVKWPQSALLTANPSVCDNCTHLCKSIGNNVMGSSWPVMGNMPGVFPCFDDRNRFRSYHSPWTGCHSDAVTSSAWWLVLPDSYWRLDKLNLYQFNSSSEPCPKFYTIR